MARRVIWAYAASFVDRVLGVGRSLNEFVERGHIVPELRDNSIREIFIYSYRLVYRIEEDQISILALIHGRRDFQAAWDEKERE